MGPGGVVLGVEEEGKLFEEQEGKGGPQEEPHGELQEELEVQEEPEEEGGPRRAQLPTRMHWIKNWILSCKNVKKNESVL